LNVSQLDLSSNELCLLDRYAPYTAEGITAIADALRVNGALTALNLSSNRLKDEGVSAVCKAIQSNKETKLALLNFQNNDIGPVGGNAVVAMVAVTGALTRVDVRRNHIAGDGAAQLAAAVLGNLKIEMFNEIPIKEMRADSFTELNLEKYVGVEGGMVMAGLMPVMGGLTKLSLKRNNLEEEGTKATCEALKQNKTLKELDISGADCGNIGGSAGAKHVARMLGVNGGLTSLNLSSNRIGGYWDREQQTNVFTPEGPKAIADALLVNGGLTSLNLSSNQLCGIGYLGKGTYTAEGITAIADALRVNGGLTSLDLSSNQLCGIDHADRGTYTAEGITAIADALRVNGGLTALNLSSNRLKDEGVSAVCKAIQSNKETKLASLNMVFNSIGPVGAKSVAAMVAVTGGLTSINLSENYLCGIWTDSYSLYGGQHGTYTAEGITAIADALRVNGGLTSLDLSSNLLCGLDNRGRGTYTAEGITAIADALRVNGAFGALTSVELRDNKLGDKGWGAIFAAICGNKDSKITSLNAYYENIGPAGVKLITEALRTSVTGGLTVTDLLGNKLDAEYAKMLAEVAKQKGISLCGIRRDQTTAYFSHKGLKPPDAILLASDLSQTVVTGSLTKINVSWNSFGPEGAKVFADALRVNGGLTSLDLSNNSLCGVNVYTVEGITAIADALRVNGALIECDLSNNGMGIMGKEGEALIRKAMQGKAGFKLRI